jgi:Tfp pilus assembly protein PilV
LNRGFVFSLEAVISVLLLAIAILTLFQHQTFSFKELVIIQQENDLLKVWSAKFPAEPEMASDAELLFKKKFKITTNGNYITCEAGEGKNCVSSEATLLDDSLNEKNVSIKICFE